MSVSASVVSFLLSIAIKATVLVLLAAALDLGIMRRRASAAARHLLWSITLGSALVLPLAGLLVPRLTVPVPSALSRVSAPAAPARRPDAGSTRMPDDQSISMVEDVVSPAHADVARIPARAPRSDDTVDGGGSRAFSATNIVLAVYLAGALLLFGRVAIEQRVLRRLERSARPLRDVEWHALFHSVRDELGIERRVAMLHGAANTMPLTWGVAHPAVLIPASAADWSEGRRRAVLLHELAHVTRLDCLTQTLAAIACALYWPHPGVWLAAHRLRIERELACDDQALLAGIGAHDYATHLLEIAHLHRVPAGLHALVVSMAARSHLEARLLAAIDVARRRTTPSRARRAAGAAIAALLLLPLAALHGAAAPKDAPIAASRSRAAAPAFEGEWTLRLATAIEVQAQGDGNTPHVHVMLWDPGLNTCLVRLDAIEGLAAASITSSVPDARFSLRRDAGTFVFTGAFAKGYGKGHFVFTPSSAFADSLERRGMERPTPEQQFSLARHGMNLDFLDELTTHGFVRPTTSTFVRSGLTSADVRYVREMSALGYRPRTLEALMHMANQGVTPGYVRELAELGYRGLTAEELVRLQNHSLYAPRVRQLNARAGRRLGVEELVRLRMRGDLAAAEVPPTAAPAIAVPAPVTPAPATPATPRSSSTPLDGRWRIGSWNGTMLKLDIEWSDGNQWRRAIPIAELHGLTAVQVAAPTASSATFSIDQDAGRFEFDGIAGSGQGTGRFRFAPNREFATVLRSLGIRDIDELSDHQLKNLAFGGMSAAAVRGFAALGIMALTRDDIIEMAVRILTPQYVRDLRAAGVTGTDTLRNLIEIRFSGVSPEYAREMGELGYRNLSTHDLMELWRAGVTPAFIRMVRSPGQQSPSKDELIQRAEEAKARARRGRGD